jgi:hypothetical protein
MEHTENTQNICFSIATVIPTHFSKHMRTNIHTNSDFLNIVNTFLRRHACLLSNWRGSRLKAVNEITSLSKATFDPSGMNNSNSGQLDQIMKLSRYLTELRWITGYRQFRQQSEAVYKTIVLPSMPRRTRYELTLKIVRTIDRSKRNLIRPCFSLRKDVRWRAVSPQLLTVLCRLFLLPFTDGI